MPSIDPEERLPPADDELLDRLVPGPSARRRVMVTLAIALLAWSLLVLPSEGFQSSFNDWRHTEDLQGQPRTLDAPFARRDQAAVVALGDGRVLVWGGRSTTADSGAVYDPATGDRQDLPPAPGPSRFAAAAVWTGQEAIIWGGSTGSGDIDAGGVTWNPTTGSWRSLPPAPVGLARARAVAFDGGVLFAGGRQSGVASAPTSLWLDLADGTWTQIPAPLTVINTAWSGGQLLATGPSGLSFGHQPASGWAVVAFDVRTLTWTSYADPLVTEWMALAVGDDGTVSAVTLEALNEPLRAYVWSGARWDLVAQSERSADGVVTIEYIGYPPVTVWTGEQLLLGGEGGLAGWDPGQRIFSHQVNQAFRTFGGTAVWTGEQLVAPVSQSTPGWAFTPT